MKLSVVIPLYNRRDLVMETIRSIQAQTLPVHQIIVVDDGSTDGGPEMVEQVCNAVLQLIRHTRNLGVQAARNTGMAHCTGDWLAFCDSDDLWLPEYVATNALLLAAHPELDVIFSNFRHLIEALESPTSKFDSAPPDWWTQAGRRVSADGWLFDGPRLVPQTFRWHPVFTSTTLLSAKVVARAGSFNTSIKGRSAEDGEFYLRCLYSARIAAIPEPLVLIRKHAGNFSGNKLKNLVDETWMMTYIRDHHPDALPYRAAIDEAIRLRRIDAAGRAFEECNNRLFMSLYRDVAVTDRTLKLRIKALCAGLPAVISYPIVRIIQSFRKKLI